LITKETKETTATDVAMPLCRHHSTGERYFRVDLERDIVSHCIDPSKCYLLSNFRAERRKIDVAECLLTIQGHPRSMIFVSSERAYATSY